MTKVSCFAANFAMKSNSSRVKTLPGGFDRLHRLSAFGFCAKARRSSSG